MRMPVNLFSQLFRIPKNQPNYLCQINLRRSYYVVSRGQIRSHLQRYSCCSKVTIPSVAEVRKIHVTDPKRALHPILLLLLRPLSKLITIISGRLIRKWWKKLSPEEKKAIWNKIRKKQLFIASAVSFTLVVFILYYYDHVDKTPLTNRKRFIMISNEAMFEICRIIASMEIEVYKREIVPPKHPFYQRVRRVADSIIQANKDIPEMRQIPWSFIVIDRPDITNACSLADGTLFIFTGILNVCTNDDQLAIVLSHEISHTILSHVTENLSKMYLIKAVLLIPSFICWVLFTDLWALMSDWVIGKLAKMFIELPFSRTLEREADMVGLFLAARACFDVREAQPFWSKMAVIQSSYSPVEWLSTHPTSNTRKEDLVKFLPEALNVRSQSNCPTLRNFDRAKVYNLLFR